MEHLSELAFAPSRIRVRKEIGEMPYRRAAQAQS
jgi:hypothetical protein